MRPAEPCTVVCSVVTMPREAPQLNLSPSASVRTGYRGSDRKSCQSLSMASFLQYSSFLTLISPPGIPEPETGPFCFLASFNYCHRQKQQQQKTDAFLQLCHLYCVHTCTQSSFNPTPPLPHQPPRHGGHECLSMPGWLLQVSRISSSCFSEIGQWSGGGRAEESTAAG